MQINFELFSEIQASFKQRTEKHIYYLLQVHNLAVTVNIVLAERVQ